MRANQLRALNKRVGERKRVRVERETGSCDYHYIQQFHFCHFSSHSGDMHKLYCATLSYDTV